MGNWKPLGDVASQLVQETIRIFLSTELVPTLGILRRRHHIRAV